MFDELDERRGEAGAHENAEVGEGRTPPAGAVAGGSGWRGGGGRMLLWARGFRC